MDDADSNTSILFENSEILWPRPLRFWLLLIFEVPAVTTSLFALTFILTNRAARSAIHNHTIIVLLVLVLINQLIDVPWHLEFLQKGIVSPSTPARCLVWWFRQSRCLQHCLSCSGLDVHRTTHPGVS